ncbi:MAG: hypothetical protein C0483_01240 [Pirellula sp.]|nr:hypothetical protein [Pirellula sp.]
MHYLPCRRCCFFSLYRRRPAIAWLIAVFFLLLAPTSSFLPVIQPLAEHRMYLPLAVVASACVVGIYLTATYDSPASSSARLRIANVLGAGVLVALVVTTSQRNEVYRSRVAMWTDVTTKSPDNYRAWGNLANAYDLQHDYPRMLESALQGLQVNERSDIANFQAGTALMKLNDPAKASAFLQRAIEFENPYVRKDPIFRTNLGATLRNVDPDRAIRLYREALEIDPYCVEALVNLGNDRARHGDFAGAIQDYQAALAVDPQDQRVVALLQMARDDLQAAGAGS